MPALAIGDSGPVGGERVSHANRPFQAVWKGLCRRYPWVASASGAEQKRGGKRQSRGYPTSCAPQACLAALEHSPGQVRSGQRSWLWSQSPGFRPPSAHTFCVISSMLFNFYKPQSPLITRSSRRKSTRNTFITSCKSILLTGWAGGGRKGNSKRRYAILVAKIASHLSLSIGLVNCRSR